MNKEGFVAKLYSFTNLVLAITLAFALIFAGLMVIKAGTLIYLEQTKKWTPTQIDVVGPDVWIKGHVFKKMDCDYFPPPLARIVGFGIERNLEVVSWSPTRSRSWPMSEFPQEFGPWQVKDGASAQELDLYQLFDCFDTLPIGKFQVYLGRVKVSKEL